VAAAVTEDWAPVIENCDLSSWREALAAALTHTNDEFPYLCESLGARMDPKLAQLCFLCGGNLDKLVGAWMAVHRASSPEKLQVRYGQLKKRTPIYCIQAVQIGKT